jgi:hypothetical protein
MCRNRFKQFSNFLTLLDGASFVLPEILVVFAIYSCGNPGIRHACFGLHSSLHTGNVLQYEVYSKRNLILNFFRKFKDITRIVENSPKLFWDFTHL